MGTIVFGTVRPLPRKRRIFRWRNYLRARPVISQRPDSPMRILNTKSSSYASLGSAIGTELVFEQHGVDAIGLALTQILQEGKP